MGVIKRRSAWECVEFSQRPWLGTRLGRTNSSLVIFTNSDAYAGKGSGPSRAQSRRSGWDPMEP